MMSNRVHLGFHRMGIALAALPAGFGLLTALAAVVDLVFSLGLGGDGRLISVGLAGAIFGVAAYICVRIIGWIVSAFIYGK